MTISLRLRLFLCITFSSHPLASADTHSLQSPDGRLQVKVIIEGDDPPRFEVTRDGTPVAGGSLGLEFAGSGPLAENLRVVDTRRTSRDEWYSIPVGKASGARDQHHELTLSLEENAEPRRRLDIVLRAFDDGIAFRYEVLSQPALKEFVLTDELTRFTFPGTPTARLLPLGSYTTSYEAYYKSQPVSKIAPTTLVGLPMLLEHRAGEGKPIWIAVTEANLTDYAGMYLARVADKLGTLAARLAPLPGRDDGAKVIGQAPHVSPWRVLMIAGDPGRLIESNIIFHLNEPSKIEDTSWIRPGKTTFPWWNGYAVEDVDFTPGVNTATMKHYIDFCAAEGIPFHSLDGLDTAWYGGPIVPTGPTNITTAAPSIDLPEVLRHAKQQGVRLRLWMHWRALAPQIDEAFALYEKWGIEGVMVDFMDRDDQEMVRFYHAMAEKAARHHLTITFHGAYKPTGMERTWPNVLSYEGVLNQEYNKWGEEGSMGSPPAHNLNAAFVRMLAGPLDYHQGGMRNVLPADFRPRNRAPLVPGTRGHQLAMYVVYQNHLPMLADDPAAYRDTAGWEFLARVPTTWDETRVLVAEIDMSIVIARRHGDTWWVGGMTAGGGRELELPLEFLGDATYEAEWYVDRPAAGPTSLARHQRNVSASDTLPVKMPPAGGFVARLLPVK